MFERVQACKKECSCCKTLHSLDGYINHRLMVEALLYHLKPNSSTRRNSFHD